MGAAAEETVIQRFNTSTEALQRRSAARLLGRVGGSNSLPLLEQALTGADAELRVLLEKAIASVRSRTGG
jgi:HEAT repeat protein